MTELATFTQEHTVPYQRYQRFMDEVTPELFGAMQQNSFLGRLPKDELAGLLSGCVVKEIGTDECLTRQGEPVDLVYFIWKGHAKAVLNGSSRTDNLAVLSVLKPGEDIGLMSIVDTGPHSATVISLTRLRAIGINRRRMQTILQRHPEWYEIIAKELLSRLRNSGFWMENLL